MPLIAEAASTADEYIASLPDDRRATVAAVRDVVRAHLPPGFQEGIPLALIGETIARADLDLFIAHHQAVRGSSRATRNAGNDR